MWNSCCKLWIAGCIILGMPLFLAAYTLGILWCLAETGYREGYKALPNEILALKDSK